MRNDEARTPNRVLTIKVPFCRIVSSIPIQWLRRPLTRKKNVWFELVEHIDTEHVPNVL